MIKQLLALILPIIALLTLLSHVLISALSGMWVFVVLDAISAFVVMWLLGIIISILFGEL